MAGGQIEQGLAVLAEALARVGRTGERNGEAELYRVKGALLLQSRPPRRAAQGSDPRAAEAEGCWHQALTCARQQQAKARELQVALSLSRLWQEQGKQAAARELLAPIYSWFTEGFYTADLEEAKSLLAQLSGASRRRPDRSTRRRCEIDQPDVEVGKHQKAGGHAARGSSSSCRSGYQPWNTVPSS